MKHQRASRLPHPILMVALIWIGTQISASTSREISASGTNSTSQTTPAPLFSQETAVAAVSSQETTPAAISSQETTPAAISSQETTPTTISSQNNSSLSLAVVTANFSMSSQSPVASLPADVTTPTMTSSPDDEDDGNNVSRIKYTGEATSTTVNTLVDSGSDRRASSAEAVTNDTTTNTIISTPSTDEDYVLAMRVEKRHKYVHVTWTANPKLKADIAGLVVGYTILRFESEAGDDDNDDDDDDDNAENECDAPHGCGPGGSTYFHSALLPPDANTYALHLPKARKVRVCVHAELKVDVIKVKAKVKDVGLPSAVAKEDEEEDDKDQKEEEEWKEEEEEDGGTTSCRDVLHWEETKSDGDSDGGSDNRYISGILASVVFLLPCVVLLLCVMQMDRRKRRMAMMIGEQKEPLISPPGGHTNVAMIIGESEVILTPQAGSVGKSGAPLVLSSSSSSYGSAKHPCEDCGGPGHKRAASSISGQTVVVVDVVEGKRSGGKKENGAAMFVGGGAGGGGGSGNMAFQHDLCDSGKHGNGCTVLNVKL